MTANANRFSIYTSTSVGSGSEGKHGEPKRDMWSSMLDSVASGKRLPEKNLLVLGMYSLAMDIRARWTVNSEQSTLTRSSLGGSEESQRDFLEALSDSERRRNFDRQNYRMPPIANSFALGYTYYDVLDADQEGSLSPSLPKDSPPEGSRIADSIVYRYPGARFPPSSQHSFSVLHFSRSTPSNSAIDTQYLNSNTS